MLGLGNLRKIIKEPGDLPVSIEQCTLRTNCFKHSTLLTDLQAVYLPNAGPYSTHTDRPRFPSAPFPSAESHLSVLPRIPVFCLVLFDSSVAYKWSERVINRKAETFSHLDATISMRAYRRIIGL